VEYLREKKGMGMIGIFLILILTAFFFTMFYIVLYQVYTNLFMQLITDSDTLAFYNGSMVPIMLAMPVVFLISLMFWGILQTQNPFSMFTITGIWLVILFSWVVFSMGFVVMDPWIMKQLPAMLPMDANYTDVYNNFVITLWRPTMPWAVAIILNIFGLFMAPAYFESRGNTWSTGRF
jgi:hypothetical protein